jgi:hypothetical protein
MIRHFLQFLNYFLAQPGKVCDIKRHQSLVSGNIGGGFRFKIMNVILKFYKMLSLLYAKLHASSFEVIQNFVHVPLALRVEFVPSFLRYSSCMVVFNGFI